MDPASHEWKVKDHAKLEALLQMAEIGARRGIMFAGKTGINPAVLSMIYEKAAHQRTRGSDASSLDALRNFWRCALLGNMCWQLAHTHKAEAVDQCAGGGRRQTREQGRQEQEGRQIEWQTDGEQGLNVIQARRPGRLSLVGLDQHGGDGADSRHGADDRGGRHACARDAKTGSNRWS